MLSIADVLDRFRSVDNQTTRRDVHTTDLENVDVAKGRLDLASSMGTTDEYISGLKPLLEERLEELEDLMPFCIESHAKLVDLQARRSEVRRFIELFESEGE